MQDFRNLSVWQKAHNLAKAAYAISEHFSAPRYYKLRDQLVRAALSVPANIAEGCGRGGDRELRRFVRIALGSASELEYYLLFARDVGLLTDTSYEPLAVGTVEVKRMLTGLATRLTASIEQSLRNEHELTADS
jgi:four helix bundle protein